MTEFCDYAMLLLGCALVYKRPVCPSRPSGDIYPAHDAEYLRRGPAHTVFKRIFACMTGDHPLVETSIDEHYDLGLLLARLEVCICLALATFHRTNLGRWHEQLVRCLFLQIRYAGLVACSRKVRITAHAGPPVAVGPARQHPPFAVPPPYRVPFGTHVAGYSTCVCWQL
jgi:hypothetical protein